MKKLIYFSALAVLVSPAALYAQKEKPNSKLNKGEKLDRSVRPTPGPAPEIKMEDAKSFVLPNGLKVFVVENHKLPRVSFSVNFDIKPFAEGEKNGTSSFAGELLGTATTTMTKDDINKKVDFIGAHLNTSQSGVSGSCLTKHSDELLSIMSDVLVNAKFTQEELDKIKNQTQSGLSTVKSDPQSMMNNMEGVVFYGKDHPYGEVMKPEHVDNVTLDDCKDYYTTYVRPNISYLTIVGDVTLEEAKAMAEKYFNGWQRGEVSQTPPPSVNGPKEVVVSMVDKPGAPQSVVNIGYPLDYKPGTLDDAKIKLMNEILGGGASSRLFRNIRETYNFSYGAYSSFRSDEFKGRYVCFGNIRAEATDSAITEFLREMKRIATEPVTQEELTAAKNNLAGKFSIALERPSTVAQYALYTDKYKLPADYYRNYLKRLEGVTVDDILQTAQKYVHTDKLHILVVGDKAKLEERLQKFATSGKIKTYDAFGDPAVSLKKVPDGVTAKTVLDKYVEVIGGAKNIAKVKDETVEMKMSLMGQTVNISTKKMKGGLYYSSATMGAMVIEKKVCDGTRAKSSGMQGNKDSYSAEELAELKHEAEICPEMKYAEWGYKTNLLGIDKIDGKEVYKMEVTKPGDEGKTFEYYDVSSGLKVRTESTESTPRGDVLIVTDIKDYKVINNINYPHTMVVNQGGQVMKMEVTKIELNKKLKKSEFKVE